MAKRLQRYKKDVSQTRKQPSSGLSRSPLPTSLRGGVGWFVFMWNKGDVSSKVCISLAAHAVMYLRPDAK